MSLQDSISYSDQIV